MARRRFADDPTSRLAIWARRCAFFALAATVLSILIVRSGILEIEPALATFAGALVFAVIGIVLAFGAFIVIWKDGSRGMGHAFAAIAIGLALIAYPAYLGYRAYTLPMINDITTDALDPPRFDVLARLRPRGTVEYAGLYAAELQRKAYSDVEPLSVNSPSIVVMPVSTSTRRFLPLLVVMRRRSGTGLKSTPTAVALVTAASASAGVIVDSTVAAPVIELMV